MPCAAGVRFTAIEPETWKLVLQPDNHSQRHSYIALAVENNWLVVDQTANCFDDINLTQNLHGFIAATFSPR
jgi:hypothetical protein